MRLPNFSHLATAFSRAYNRFPLVLLTAIIGTVTACLLIDDFRWDWGDVSKDFLVRLLMTCFLGLPLFTALRAFAESRAMKALPCILVDVAGVVFLTLYLIFNGIQAKDFMPLPMFRWFGFWLMFHLMAAVLPYLRKASVADFWEYNKQLLSNAVAAALYSFVMFAGLALAILAVDQLFNLNIDEEIYGQLFVIITGIFATIYFLSEFPLQYDGLASKNAPYTTVIRNLTKYILIPLVVIYFVILYAYSAKIGIQWELPQGWVSKLVLSFSIAGIFTYLLNYQLVDHDDSSLVKQFRKWFFFVLAPMVVLLFVAIIRRLNDYGMTESRYVVLSIGIWLTVVSLYFIISKKDDIRFIPTSLLPFILVACFGPLSAYETSVKSQIGQLKEQFTKYNLFENGLVQPLKDTIQQTDYQQINSSLRFLESHHKLVQIEPWFPVSFDSINPLINAPSGVYDLPTGINHYLQLERGLVYDNGARNIQSFYAPEPDIVDIAGYSTMRRIYYYRHDNNSGNANTLQVDKDGYLFYQYNDSTPIRIKMNDYLKNAIGLNQTYYDINDIEDATLYFDQDSIQGKLILNNISFTGGGKLEVESLNGMLFLK